MSDSRVENEGHRWIREYQKIKLQVHWILWQFKQVVDGMFHNMQYQIPECMNDKLILENQSWVSFLILCYRIQAQPSHKAPREIFWRDTYADRVNQILIEIDVYIKFSIVSYAAGVKSLIFSCTCVSMQISTARQRKECLDRTSKHY